LLRATPFFVGSKADWKRKGLDASVMAEIKLKLLQNQGSFPYIPVLGTIQSSIKSGVIRYSRLTLMIRKDEE
jgi:hypothetical protein